MKYIECKNRQNQVTKVMVSDCDYELLNQDKWHIGSHGYAVRTIPGTNGKKMLMHSLIMGECDGYEIDHIDHNPLNNTRENLRFVTHQQNSQNRRKPNKANPISRYKGVKPNNSKKNPWQANIIVNGHSIYLGSFKTEFAAAKAYDRAALNYFGQYACLNFPANTYIPSATNLESYVSEMVKDMIV